jgi:hypothetical protein
LRPPIYNPNTINQINMKDRLLPDEAITNKIYLIRGQKELTQDEFQFLRSQNATSNEGHSSNLSSRAFNSLICLSFSIRYNVNSSTFFINNLFISPKSNPSLIICCSDGTSGKC